MRGDRPVYINSYGGFVRFTPHARGSTVIRPFSIYTLPVYPACAGIDPCGTTIAMEPVCLPRMRGDRPPDVAVVIRHTSFTPHARGSTLLSKCIVLSGLVYPACAGIDRVLGRCRSQGCSLPRMRGDRPSGHSTSLKFGWFTPHARGSTSEALRIATVPTVYPACAGIDRKRAEAEIELVSLPRMRGDRPRPFGLSASCATFTPHARGSTRSKGP